MWYRADLKARAKTALRVNGYWTAVLVMLVILLLTGGVGGAGSGGPSQDIIEQNDLTMLYGQSQRLSTALSFFIFSIAVLVVGYSIFVATPLLVGKNRFFLEHREQPSTVGRIFAPFTRGYLNVVKTMFLQSIIVFLWSLLLIVPGIIKSFQYILVPYILAENPEIEWRRALDLSREMTDGNKFRIFVLGLSFIGWYLLGALALGIGLIFVAPYAEATMAELYAHLRGQAIARGVTDERELPGVA
jgi:uncharacterized membrane protein